MGILHLAQTTTQAPRRKQVFALSHSVCVFPVWFGAVPPNPSSPTRLEAGLESWSSWDSCLGLPCSPFPTGAWAPVLRPPACSAPGAPGSPHPCPAFSELRDTGSARAASLHCCLLSQQRAACPPHRIISECEPALHLLCFILARPQSVHLFPTCCFCSPGSREYLTAGLERQHGSAGFSQSRAGETIAGAGSAFPHCGGWWS